MDFAELIALLQSGEAGETIYDDLTASYNNMSEGAAAALAAVQAELAELQAKHTAVMAHNYELLTAVPGNDPDPAPGGPADEEENEDLATFADLISYE